MGMEVAWVFLLMHCFAHSSAEFGQFDPVQEWDKLEKVIATETAQELASPKSRSWKLNLNYPPPPKWNYVPLSKPVPAASVRMHHFAPERGERPLPDSVREMLRATATPTTTSGTTTATPDLINVLCHLDRIYVRVQKHLFNGLDAFGFLKLGSCPVNQATSEHYYMLYLLRNNCGFQLQSNADDLIFANEVTFQPNGTVLRSVPFTVAVGCRYHRFFNSYSTGFYPTLQGGTVVKGLRGKTGVSLIAQDASGNEIPAGQPFTLGQPMCFEVKLSDQASVSAAQRLYINMCRMTTSQDPNSSPTYTVISNQGCMVDAKSTVLSKFKPTSGTSQKFCIGAFVFKDSPSAQQNVQQLYMHCEIYLGSSTPTEGSKACNFDVPSQSWIEVTGHDVCHCCETSSCPSSQPRVFKTMVSSQPWEVDNRPKSGSVEPEPQLKVSAAEDHADFLNYWDDEY